MKVLVRNAGDINRLRLHLLTHWTPPRVEVGIDKLPPVDSQRAQDRFVRLAGRCNCLLGEMLGGVTLLGGSFLAWISIRGWRGVGFVVVATLCAVLIGKTIELAWTRVRLLLVLRNLRRRLGDVAAGRYPVTPVKTNAVPAAFSPSAAMSLRPAWIAADGDAMQDSRLRQPLFPEGPARPRVLLRDAADINRLFVRLATRWTLPRIDVHLDALPQLEAERAQDRFVRLSSGYNYLLAGVLAMACILGGLFYVVWTSSQDLMWTPHQGWREMGLVAVATLYAALLGCAIEVLWTRARLLLVVHGLRRRLRKPGN